MLIFSEPAKLKLNNELKTAFRASIPFRGLRTAPHVNYGVSSGFIKCFNKAPGRTQPFLPGSSFQGCRILVN